MTEDAGRDTAGVRFETAGRLHYVDSAGMRLEPGEYVVVDGPHGPQVGRVVIGTEQVLVNELGDDERPLVLRLATPADVDRMVEMAERAKDILPEARSLAEKARLDLHIANAFLTLDGERLLLSFTSETRADARPVARELGERLGLRVDVRQIGARDRARMAGGYGVCGRELCCSSWLTSFPSISIRMAKNQEKPLNPQKISGLCGRLLCCLSYEDEGYKTMRETLPRVGQRCSTPTGEGKVIGLNVLRREVTLLVDRQRVVVGDADLGTVVRWDPSARNAEPPPSIPREPDATEPVAVAEPPPPAESAPEAPAPPRARRRGRERQAPKPEGGRSRRFERRGTTPEPPAPPPAEPGASRGAESPAPRRNRRSRRRGRGGGS